MKKQILTLTAAILLASCGGGASSTSSQAPSGSSSPEATSSKAEESSSKAESSEESSSKAESSSAEQTSSGEQHDYIITEPVEIEFKSGMNDTNQSMMKSFAEAFMKIEPNVTVNVNKETGNWSQVTDKVYDGLAVDNYPDLLPGYPDAFQQFLDVGKIVKLDSFINDKTYGWDESDREDLIESYVEEGSNYQRTGTFSLPFAKSTEALYYNKDVVIGMDLSGVDSTINNGNPLDVNYINNLTWEEFFDKLCPAIISYNDSLGEDEKILKDVGNFKTTVLGYHSDDNLFITLAEQYGYGYTSVDEYGDASINFVNDNMKALVKKLNTYKNKGYLTTNGLGNFGNFKDTSTSNLFCISSTGGLSYQVTSAFETGVAPIPQAANAPRKVINQGPSICILDHGDSNRALASWLFYKFITNETNNLFWAINTGYSPIRYSVNESDVFQKYINEGKSSSDPSAHLAALATEYISNPEFVGEALFSSPVFRGSGAARTNVGGIITSALTLSAADCTDEKINEIFQSAYDNTLKFMN